MPNMPQPEVPRSKAGVAHEALVRAFTHERFVDMFLGQSRRAQIGLLVAALLIAAIWFGRTHAIDALAWAVLVVLVTSWRIRYTTQFVRSAPHGHTTQRIVLLLLVNSLLMTIPLVDFTHFSELERAAVTIILLGIATASAATTSGYRAVFLVFAAPALMCLALAWAIAAGLDSGGLGSWGLAVLVLLFLLFLGSVGQQVSLVFEDSSRYRYGDKQLNVELQQALKLADESIQARTHFLAAASHDLRQPVHSMNVLVAALSMRQLDAHTREIVALLNTVNQSLSIQMDSLLDISKLDAGAVTPHCVAVRLDLLLQSLHETLAPVAADKGLRLELQQAGEISVLTDEALLTRVLSNLLDNAFKFTRRDGAILLGLRRDGLRAVVRVADSGIGIAPEEQERVFREFYQVANFDRDRSQGLGLGLAIVRRLCALLDVELSLQSQPGVGTTVELALPTTGLLMPVPPATPTVPLAAGLVVLVIDDELVVRKSMQLLLTQLGCIVHVADGAQAALEIATSQRLDVVLSDYRLRAGENGISVIRAIQNRCPAVRVALITGDTAPDRMQEAKAAGVALLYKPVALEKLLTVLHAPHSGNLHNNPARGSP